MTRSPWLQFVLFVVLVVVLALPTYTSVPRGWAFAALVLWSLVFFVLHLPRWPGDIQKGGV